MGITVNWDGSKFVDVNGRPADVPFGKRLLCEGTNFVWVLREGKICEAADIQDYDLFLEELREGDTYRLLP